MINSAFLFLCLESSVNGYIYVGSEVAIGVQSVVGSKNEFSRRELGYGLPLREPDQ